MIAVDPNILVFSEIVTSPWHVRARATVRQLAEGRRPWALCLEHGVSELLTADRDFSRFADLRVRNPLDDDLGR